MEQPAYAIDGTKEPNTRLNIDDFSTNDDYKIQWGLYLRALNVLQAAPPTDFKGYYRIAGIYQCFSGFIFTSLTVISNSWSADYDVARRHRSAGQDNLLLTWDVRSPPSLECLVLSRMLYTDLCSPTFLSWHRPYLLLIEVGGVPRMPHEMKLKNSSNGLLKKLWLWRRLRLTG